MRRRLRDESGVALATAVVILAALMLTGTTLVYYAGSNANHAEISTDDAKALNLAEAGTNYARSILWNAADPTVSTAVPSGTVTLENGTVNYSATYDSAAKVWTITGTGTFTNPTGGATPITRTMSSQVAVTGGTSWDPAWGYLFADTSVCTNLKNNITIDAPIYVRGDLCMENSARITSDLVQVRGKVDIKDSASIGTAAADGAVQDVQVGGGCSRPWGGPWTSPCGTAHQVYRINFSNTVPNIAKPSVNLSYWYTNAKPGPNAKSCTTGSYPGTFDKDTTLNRNNDTQYLFPASGYDCTVKDGSGATLGRIAYTPGSPASFHVEGVIFFDGKIELNGNRTVVYTGRGTIYATDEIKMQNNLNLCPTTTCDAAAWDPDTTILGWVGGASADSGFLIENYSVFHGSIYVVNDYYQKNNVSVCGPVIAQELVLDNLSTNCYVPFGSLPPGAPGAISPAAVSLQNVANSYTDN